MEARADLFERQHPRSASTHTDTVDAPRLFNALIANTAVDIERTRVPVSAVEIKRCIYWRLVVFVARP